MGDPSIKRDHAGMRKDPYGRLAVGPHGGHSLACGSHLAWRTSQAAFDVEIGYKCRQCEGVSQTNGRADAEEPRRNRGAQGKACERNISKNALRDVLLFKG